MAEPAGRVGDHGQSPGSRGVAVNGSPDVDINDKPALRVCDKGTGETGPCAGKIWEPVMGSATVEVNGKPLVRKTDMTQHFACGQGQMIDGSPDVEVGGPGALPSIPTLDALVKYIYDEMMKNKDDPRVQRILRNNQMFQNSLNPSPFGGPTMPDMFSMKRAMDQWKDLVGYGAPMDHKGPIRSAYGPWSYDPASNTSIEYQTWSNVHYGFVGQAAGFDEKTLLDGAGLAQWSKDNPNAGTWETLGKYGEFIGGDTAKYDQADDQAAIKIGTALWKKYKETGTLTEQDVKDAILQNKGALQSATGPVC